jgi:hypothetical protein
VVRLLALVGQIVVDPGDPKQRAVQLRQLDGGGDAEVGVVGVVVVAAACANVG